MDIFGFLKSFQNNGARDRVAADINVDTGALERCPLCQEVFDREHKERIPAAEAEANRRIDNHDPSVACFEGDREDLLKRMQRIRNEAPFQCICHRQH